MNFLEKYDLNLSKILKGIGIIFLGIILLFFISRLLNGFSPVNYRTRMQAKVGRFSNEIEPDGVVSLSESFSKGASRMNVSAPVFRDNDFSLGDDAENYETSSYRVKIETRNLKNDCDSIFSLKAKDYIIFENSNEGKRFCNFRFKVKKDNVSEVLALLKSLKPKELNENIETIKKQIENFISEEDILKKKLQVIDNTLSNAISSYDELSRLATKMKDANSLASVIEGKIRIIERLSQEKINISARLERIGKSKAESLDRLEYVYFNVDVYENKYIDLDNIKESWKNSIKSFVQDINKILQNLSLGLIMLLIYILEYSLALILIIFVAKYIWKLLKKIWQD